MASSFLKAFNFNFFKTVNGTLPNTYPLNVEFEFFVKADIQSLFTKIMTDVVSRTEGLENEEVQQTLWDNCLANESNRGLISLLAEAMTNMADLFLVYRLGVLRKATQEEQEQIRNDYINTGGSSVGVFISFKNFKTAQMLRIFSGMEYSVLNSLNKTMKLSSALQYKMAKLRESVGATDKEAVIAQAKSIASGLSCGDDVLLDGEDEIVTSKPDMESVEKSIHFLDAKRCFYLNLPLAYLTGEQTSGISSTGEADSIAIERGLKMYYVSILKPAVLAVFKTKTSYKSQNFRMINQALEALKTFELTGEDYISLENKRLLTSNLFEVENDVKGKPKEEVEPIDDNLRTEENTSEDSEQEEA